MHRTVQSALVRVCLAAMAAACTARPTPEEEALGQQEQPALFGEIWLEAGEKPLPSVMTKVEEYDHRQSNAA